MEKDRRIKILSIVALVLAITGMSLGFAAFSSTLTISSSATVTPNSDEFIIKVYGLKESMTYEQLANIDASSVSDTMGMGYVYNSTGSTFTPATIINDKSSIDIRDISVNFNGDKYANIEYYFFIRNEGQYNATIPFSQFEQYFDKTYEKKCTAEAETNQELTTEVCDNISLFISLGGLQENILRTTNDKSTIDFASGYTLEPNEILFLCIGIGYKTSVLPDGNMSIEFGDINLDFTTAPIN